MKVRKKFRERKMKLDWIFDFSSTEIEVHSDDNEFFLKTFNPLKEHMTKQKVPFYILSYPVSALDHVPHSRSHERGWILGWCTPAVKLSWLSDMVLKWIIGVSDRHKGSPSTQFGYPDIKTVNEFISKFCQPLLFTNSFNSISVFHLKNWRNKKL